MHSYKKHIEINHHFIHDHIAKYDIELLTL